MDKKPENSLIINVCIVPPQTVGVQCVELSQSVASPDTLFSLDGESKFPHMTVYMARFATQEVANVIAGAERATQSVKSFTCEHTGYFMTAGRYLEASYRKSDAFLELQNLFVDNLKEYRINPGQPHQEDYFAPYTSEQEKNATETGYDLVGNIYRPHITLTRYAEGKVPQEFPAMKATSLSFPLHTICVYEADDNGAVFKKLVEYKIR